MTEPRPVFHQLNTVSGDVAASLEFYRRLGVAIPEEGVWGARMGDHHASAGNAGGAGVAAIRCPSLLNAGRVM
jgi:hypothetical protein